MLQQRNIKVYLLDGQEYEFRCSYEEILDGLQQNDNTKSQWNLYDYQTGALVNQQSNIEDIEKLRALKNQQIGQIFEDQKEYHKLKEGNQKTQDQLLLAEQKIINLSQIQKAQEVGAINVGQLSKEIEKKDIEILQLQAKINNFQDDQKQLKQLINEKQQSIQFNVDKIGVKNAAISELQKFKVESQEFQSENYQLNCEIEKLKQFKNKSEEYEKHIKEQSKALIEKDDQLEKLKQQLYQTNQPQDTGNRIIQELGKFQTDEDVQQQKETITGNIDNHQLKFLNSLLNKLSIDLYQERKKNPCSSSASGRIPSTNAEICQVYLQNQQFDKILKKKDFFIRARYLTKKPARNISLNIIMNLQQPPKESIMIDEQIIQIQLKTPNQKPYSEYEAIDIISSQLLIENFTILFDEIYNQIQSNVEESQGYKIKFPKLFLVKDYQNYYYVYQECLQESTSTQYQYFQELNSFHKYLNFFLYYFYISMNENLAITEYELETLQYENENGQINQEIFIKNMVVHSNYQQAFSILDKGKDQIKTFGKMHNDKQPQNEIEKTVLKNFKMHALNNWNKWDI